MKKNITIDLLRHGEPEGGDILRGRVNPVLTERGWQQMHASAGSSSQSETLPWTDIVTSSLDRCRAFGEHLNSEHDIPLQVEDNWQEIDYGDWDGMLIKDWRVAAADQFKAFRNDLSKLSPPNGEPYLVFKDRILTAWQALCAKPDGSHILVITHGGVMRVVIPTVLGMPLNKTFPLNIPFACLSRIHLTVSENSDGSIEQLNASFSGHNLAQH